MDAGHPPTAVYDNRCDSCAGFAKMIGVLSRGGVRLVGLYTPEGREMQGAIGEGATGMFWFVKDGVAYGGRASILPVMVAVLTSRGGSWPKDAPAVCTGPDCTGIGLALRRTWSLLSKGRKVSIEKPKT